MNKPLMTSFIAALPELIKSATGGEIHRVSILTQVGIVRGVVDYEFTEALENTPSLPMVHDGAISLKDVEMELYDGNVLEANSMVLSHDAILGVIPNQSTIRKVNGGER